MRLPLTTKDIRLATLAKQAHEQDESTYDTTEYCGNSVPPATKPSLNSECTLIDNTIYSVQVLFRVDKVSPTAATSGMLVLLQAQL